MEASNIFARVFGRSVDLLWPVNTPYYNSEIYTQRRICPSFLAWQHNNKHSRSTLCCTCSASSLRWGKHFQRATCSSRIVVVVVAAAFASAAVLSAKVYWTQQKKMKKILHRHACSAYGHKDTYACVCDLYYLRRLRCRLLWRFMAASTAMAMAAVCSVSLHTL